MANANLNREWYVDYTDKVRGKCLYGGSKCKQSCKKGFFGDFEGKYCLRCKCAAEIHANVNECLDQCAKCCTVFIPKLDGTMKCGNCDHEMLKHRQSCFLPRGAKRKRIELKNLNAKVEESKRACGEISKSKKQNAMGNAKLKREVHFEIGSVDDEEDYKLLDKLYSGSYKVLVLPVYKKEGRLTIWKYSEKRMIFNETAKELWKKSVSHVMVECERIYKAESEVCESKLYLNLHGALLTDREWPDEAFKLANRRVVQIYYTNEKLQLKAEKELFGRDTVAKDTMLGFSSDEDWEDIDDGQEDNDLSVNENLDQEFAEKNRIK